jgi:hypothetical protein
LCAVGLTCCCSTWLQHTERRRDKAGGLQALQHSLCEAHGRRLLCAWQAASVALQHTREQQQAAEHHHERRLQQHALQVWQSATAEAAVAALQAEAAEEWHRRQLLQASVRGLVWYCWCVHGVHRQRAARALQPTDVLRPNEPRAGGAGDDEARPPDATSMLTSNTKPLHALPTGTGRAKRQRRCCTGVVCCGVWWRPG